MSAPDHEYIGWLVRQSMLENVKAVAARYPGQGRMWQHPYAEAQPRAASALASVWFTAYPPAVMTRAGESVLRTLGDEALWQAFATIGIQGIHTGPMKQAGGIQDAQQRRRLTATLTASVWRSTLSSALWTNT